MATEKSDISQDAPQGVPTLSSTADDSSSYPEEKPASSTDEKGYHAKADVESTEESEGTEDVVLQDARDIATHVITIDDDPTANPLTFRSFFIGIGLSAFGGVLAEIYYFKPQTVLVSTLFLVSSLALSFLATC